MKTVNIIFLLFLIVLFFMGMYIYITNNRLPTKENMENKLTTDDTKTCPDLLINKGDVILLYNTKQPEIDGVNPIPFYTLDEYINYLEIQHRKGITCPILYLQKENNTQGQDVYRMRPGPFEQEGGLPTVSPVVSGDVTMLNTGLGTDPSNPLPIVDAARANPPYNAGNYPGFDAHGFDIGNYTQLDAVHDSTKQAPISDNPMDLNWGGVMYTQQMIESGKYDDYNVYRPNYVTPKGTIYPDLHPEMNYPRH